MPHPTPKLEHLWKTYFVELPSYGKHWGHNGLWDDSIFSNKIGIIKNGLNSLIEKVLGCTIIIFDDSVNCPFAYDISPWFVGKPSQQLPLVFVGCYSFGNDDEDDNSLVPFADFILFPFWEGERVYGNDGKDYMGYVLKDKDNTWNPQNEWFWKYTGWDHGYPSEWDHIVIPEWFIGKDYGGYSSEIPLPQNEDSNAPTDSAEHHDL